MAINNRGLFGQPTLPYVDGRVYAGDDVFVDLTFLDHAKVGVTPSSFTYELDDITNNVNMIPSTVVSSGISSSKYTLQLDSDLMVMTYTWSGSQLCQLWVTADYTDSVTGNPAQSNGVWIIELCAIQVPSTQ